MCLQCCSRVGGMERRWRQSCNRALSSSLCRAEGDDTASGCSDTAEAAHRYCTPQTYFIDIFYPSVVSFYLAGHCRDMTWLNFTTTRSAASRFNVDQPHDLFSISVLCNIGRRQNYPKIELHGYLILQQDTIATVAFLASSTGQGRGTCELSKRGKDSID